VAHATVHSTYKTWVAAMTIGGLLGLHWSIGWAVGIVLALFWLWGMRLADPIREQQFKEACRYNPWMRVSEAAETGYMGWVVFSWLLYLAIRDWEPDDELVDEMGV